MGEAYRENGRCSSSQIYKLLDATIKKDAEKDPGIVGRIMLNKMSSPFAGKQIGRGNRAMNRVKWREIVAETKTHKESCCSPRGERSLSL